MNFAIHSSPVQSVPEQTHEVKLKKVLSSSGETQQKDSGRRIIFDPKTQKWIIKFQDNRNINKENEKS